MSEEFLSRWSRRKRGSADEEAAPPEPAAAAPAEALPADESDEEVLARLGLQHPDEMAQGDDFAAFLRAAVPRHLKTLAYRRLWRSNPTLACLDGLNDYDGDFTGTGVPEGGLKTSYEVGRGLLGRIADLAEEPAEASPAEDAEDDRAYTTEEGASANEDHAGGEAETPPELESVQQNDTQRTARRRMVFRPKA